jgi:sensor domain CHASE-containing protein
MEFDYAGGTYYTLNSTLTPLLAYVLPWLVLLCVLIWQVFAIQKQSNKQNRANAEMTELLSQIKKLLEQRNS